MKQMLAIAIISTLMASGCGTTKSAATPFNIAEIRRYAPETDVSSLSNQQIHMVLTIIHSGDETEGKKALWVQSYLRNSSRLNSLF